MTTAIKIQEDEWGSSEIRAGRRQILVIWTFVAWTKSQWLRSDCKMVSRPTPDFMQFQCKLSTLTACLLGCVTRSFPIEFSDLTTAVRSAGHELAMPMESHGRSGGCVRLLNTHTPWTFYAHTPPASATISPTLNFRTSAVTPLPRTRYHRTRNRFFFPLPLFCLIEDGCRVSTAALRGFSTFLLVHFFFLF